MKMSGIDRSGKSHKGLEHEYTSHTCRYIYIFYLLMYEDYATPPQARSKIRKPFMITVVQKNLIVEHHTILLCVQIYIYICMYISTDRKDLTWARCPSKSEYKRENTGRCKRTEK